MSKFEKYLLIIIAVYLIAMTLVTYNNVQAKTTPETTTEVTETITEIETTTEPETIELTTVKFEDIPDLEELGVFELTAYCSCSKCCGKSDGITASGTKATANRTVAAKDFPFGTKLYINGNTYIVEDRGVGSGVIDIYFDRHSEALEFGRQYAKVFEVMN
jgi:3D (Asp-Asp-Asp) domain-containing protein